MKSFAVFFLFHSKLFLMNATKTSKRFQYKLFAIEVVFI